MTRGTIAQIRFKIPGRIIPKQSVRTRVLERNGRPFKINGRWATSQYQSPTVAAFETFVGFIARKYWKGQPPLDGPLFLELVLRMARPLRPESPYPDRKPDWLNLTKPIEDAIEHAGLIVNDSRIVDAHVKKFYADARHPEGASVVIGRIM